MRFIYFSIFASIFFNAYATDYKPWYGRSLEFEASADAVFQLYRSVAAGHYQFKRNANDFFLDLSLANSIDKYALQLEAVCADTYHHSFDLDCGKITGRYRWLDDIVGDPVSLTTGVSLIVPVTVAKQDISSFHHGNTEYFIHGAVGKESTCFDSWSSRYYAVLGVGLANQGSPWWMLELHHENHFCDSNQLRFFLKGLYGCGRESIHKRKHFRGYGPIAHRSLDVGAGYLHEFDNYSTLLLEYAYRIYAENFPLHVNFFKLEYTYPFGI